MMKVPFSPPYIDKDIENEVLEVLRSGWITTGPKVRALETELKSIMKAQEVIAVNSWTSGAALVLKWFGIGPGDEVIIPAYTYAATALSVIHCGATPIMVDSSDDYFNISIEGIRNAITEKTKAIIPVDIGGWPVDYFALKELLDSEEVRLKFNPKNEKERILGRPLILSDAAHSIGASINGEAVGTLADVTVISFHAVKNITTAEGGAVCLNLPSGFNLTEEIRMLRVMTINGQTKDSFNRKESLELGNWQYDIITDGLKINMPDICAAIGLVQLKKYEKELLPERKKVFEKYYEALSSVPNILLPPRDTKEVIGSAHIFNLRLVNSNEDSRNRIIAQMASEGITANVHFIPLPKMSYFNSLGYSIENYPNALKHYSSEISLPIYPQLTDEQISLVIHSLLSAIKKHAH